PPDLGLDAGRRKPHADRAPRPHPVTGLARGPRAAWRLASRAPACPAREVRRAGTGDRGGIHPRGSGQVAEALHLLAMRRDDPVDLRRRQDLAPLSGPPLAEELARRIGPLGEAMGRLVG